LFIDGSKEGQNTTNARPEMSWLQTARRNGQQTGCNKIEKETESRGKREKLK
jgi:hypothetical protein